jgi:hypothetical protein
MTRKDNYNFPAEEIRQALKRSRPLVNIIVPENASVEEKMKYRVSQSILTYQQESQKSFATLVEEVDIQSLNEKKLIDVCCGKLSNFSLGELLIYANNLRITFIPCYNCEVNLYPPLLGEIISSFQNHVSFCPQKIYQEHVHCSV